MKKSLLLLSCSISLAASAQKISVVELGRHTDGRTTASEIATYDSSSKKIFVTNAVTDSIDILDITNPATPTRIGGIDISPYGSGVNSVVALKNGYIAAAIEANVIQDSGKVVFFTTAGVYAKQVTVGALPDMITMTKDGKKVLVAGEGEPNSAYTVDPKGTIGIIDISGGISTLTQANVKLLSFDAAPASIPGTLRKPSTPWANDLEPEYIAVNDASTMAVVGCQEANLFVMVDLTADTIKGYKGLGFKDYNLAGNGIDASDKDNKINIQNYPVKGVYMPDAIASYTVGGNTYFVTANEGDGRDYSAYLNETRVKSLTLDPIAYPTAAALKPDSVIGRLKCLSKDVIGDIDGDGDMDQLYSFGARSFTIWDQSGTLVWDSKNEIEKYFETNHPTFFNCNEGKSSAKDDRSDDKGPEPEAAIVGKIGSKYYAFIGLERQGGIMVYDVTTPAAPVFETFISPYKSDGTSTDAGVEGLVFVPAANSHTGKNLLIASHEVSGTTTIFQINDLLPSVIEEQKIISNEYSIYPNPGHNKITIQLQQKLQGATVGIYNIIGQLVQSNHIDTEQTEIDIEQLGVGIYFIRVADNGNNQIGNPKKFIKQ
ncbi:MAG: choice-of-anchor I family protein [Bacteroidota bacterium]